MYPTSHPTSMRKRRGSPFPSTAVTRADTPAAFPGVHVTSNWSVPSPPDSRTSWRIRALSCQETSERHFTESERARPMSTLAMPAPPPPSLPPILPSPRPPGTFPPPPPGQGTPADVSRRGTRARAGGEPSSPRPAAYREEAATRGDDGDEPAHDRQVLRE